MKNPPTVFELVEPDAEAYADYSARFGQHNQDGSGSRMQTFSLILRDNGRILAGGRGHLLLGALKVRGLWVDDELRGDGIGSDLLGGIECEARERGASKAMLHTYSWQAEAFYKNHDYVEFARFEFPEGHYRIDMQKPL